jgi:hypothetical protein
MKEFEKEEGAGGEEKGEKGKMRGGGERGGRGRGEEGRRSRGEERGGEGKGEREGERGE